jgi:hypothetical protein
LTGLPPGALPLTLHAVSAKLESLPAGRVAALHFRLHPHDSEPVQIRARNVFAATADVPAEQLISSPSPERDLLLQPWPSPTMSYEVQTGTAAVPCSLLGGSQAMAALGTTAHFRGSFHAAQTTAGWQAEIRGALAKIDLEHALARPFAQRLTGFATTTFQPLIIRNNRLEQWQGTVQAGPGQIGGSLLQTLAETWKLPQLKPSKPIQPVVEYDLWHCDLDWNSRGLILRGRVAGQQAGTILAAGGQSLLGEPPAPLGPAGIVLRGFAPANIPNVPALPISATWLEWLPPSAAHLAEEPAMDNRAAARNDAQPTRR